LLRPGPPAACGHAGLISPRYDIAGHALNSGLCRVPAHVTELKTLAKTIEKWQQPVVDAVLSGYSNSKAEAHNRTAKLVARTARGFANPQSQARRVRMVTTRAARLGTRKRKPRRSRKATSPP